MSETISLAVEVTGADAGVAELSKIERAARRVGADEGAVARVARRMATPVEGSAERAMERAAAQTAHADKMRKLAEYHTMWGALRATARDEQWVTRGMQGGLDMIDGAIGRVTNGFRRMFGLVVEGATKAAGSLGLLSVGGFIGLGVHSAMSQENTAASLSALIKDRALAERILADNQRWVLDRQGGNPFGSESVNQATKDLVTAGVRPTRTALRGALEGVGAAAAASGRGDSALTAFAGSLAMIQRTQTITTRNTGVFQEYNIPLLRVLAQRFGTTEDSMSRRLGSTGGGRSILRQIGGVEGLAAILKAEYPNAITDTANTLSGRWGSFKSYVSESIQDSWMPMLDPLKEALDSAKPMIGALIESMGAGMQKVAEWAARTDWDKIQSRVEATAAAVKDTVSWVVDHKGGLIAALGAGTAVVTGAKAGLGFHKMMDPGTMVNGIAVGQGLLAPFAAEGGALAGFATAAPYVGLVVAGVVALGAGLVYAYHHSEKFHDVVDRIGKIGVRAFHLIERAVEKIGPPLWRAFGSPMWDIFVSTLTVIVDQMEMVVTVVEKVVEAFSKIKWPEPPGWIKRGLEAAWDTAKFAVNPIGELATGGSPFNFPTPKPPKISSDSGSSSGSDSTAGLGTTFKIYTLETEKTLRQVIKKFNVDAVERKPTNDRK